MTSPKEPKRAIEALGQRLHVASRDRAKKNELEELVIGKGARARFPEAGAQPLAMPVIMGRFAFAAFGGRRIGGRLGSDSPPAPTAPASCN